MTEMEAGVHFLSLTKLRLALQMRLDSREKNTPLRWK